MFDTVERTAEKSVKTAVKTTSSLLQNKTVLAVVGAARNTCMVIGLKETIKVLLTINLWRYKSSQRPVYVSWKWEVGNGI